MATYALTKSTYKSDFEETYTFTGEAAATALADQTGWVNVEKFSSIVATSQVVKAGTTDTATMALFGTIDGGVTEFALPDVASTPLDGTVTSASTAATHDLKVGYVFGNSFYGAPKPKQIRVKYSTSGTTDNKNIINGTIVIAK